MHAPTVPPGACGALLVGGASRRFGAPKALALHAGEPLAVRAHRLLQETFGEAFAVGKASAGLDLPFPVLDDGTDLQAAIVGVLAALRHAPREVCVVVPTDMPLLTGATLGALAEAASQDGADAAVLARGPLPGAFRRSVAPVLERAVARGELGLRAALRDVRCATVDCDERELANVNTRTELDDLVSPERDDG